MNQIHNISPEIFSEEKKTTSKKTNSLIALTLATVVSTTTPNTAQTQQNEPLRLHGISGGQGNAHIISASTTNTIQLESTKPISTPTKKIYTETNNSTKHEILLQKSKNASSQSEVLYFAQRFGIDIKNSSAFVQKVKDIQKQAGFSKKDQDGIIGPGTLKMLYTKYYSKTHKENPDALPKDIRARWEFHLTMQNPKYKKYPTPNVFSKSVFFGHNGGQNIPNTYLNQKLYTLAQKGKLKMKYKGKTIHIKSTGNPNSIYIGKVQGTQSNTVLTALYDDSGNLRVLGPTKAGKRGYESPENKHFTTHGVGKNYISKKYDAIMPYATFIDWPNGNHSHYGNQNSTGSHGCWRQSALQVVGMAKYTSQQEYNVYVGDSY